ncbi:MAG: ribonuclease Z [Candidatus Pacearchaeota archaeon]
MLQVVFLGTSSAVPTESRNHTGILIIYNGSHLLFDCGEGCQRQFVKVGISPLRLDKIFITHLHADHILGLSGLLQTMAMKDYNKELEIYGPQGIKDYIKANAKFFPIINTLKLKIREIERDEQFDFGDFFIMAKKLEHVAEVYGYCFVEKDKIKIKQKYVKLLGGPSPLFKLLKKGKTIEYRGRKIKPKDATFVVPGKKVSIILDTRKCKNAFNLAKRADLLIIECVYSKEMQELAREYAHLSTNDVRGIIKKAKAKKVALVHFSERFDKKEDSLLREINLKNVFIANDFMKVTVN